MSLTPHPHPAEPGPQQLILPSGEHKRGVEDHIFEARPTAIGLAIAAALLAIGLVWKVATNVNQGPPPPPKEFEFSLAEPSAEKFTLKDPPRDIVRERISDTAIPTVVESKPDIHMTVTPNNTPVETEVISIPGTVLTPQQDVIDVKIDPKMIDVTAKTDVNIPDGPEEITVVDDTPGYAIQPIAADTVGAADLFKYDKPTPAGRIGMYTFNQGPRPGRPTKGILPAFGDPNTPSWGQLGPANINLYGNNADGFFRTMSRAGGLKTRTSVDSALHWLAIHQEADGSWKCSKFDGGDGADLACTGLSMLAFMGGGHTTRKGEYSRNVLRGLEYILRHQKEDGHLTAGKDNLYTHAICAIALCEAYGRARDERIGLAAQKALNYCEKAVAADGGWRYSPKPPASDMSVTAWFIQAIKTARIAQLKSDAGIFNRALTFVDACTDAGGTKESSGAVGYMAPGGEGSVGNHPALTAAAMMIRQFSGVGTKHHLLVKGAELTKGKPPTWKDKDFYYWYYATYAMHNMGEEYRIFWNQRIRDVLLENQARDGDNAGSWDPKGDKWGNRGGRVYTTALGALCLEVYYRYDEALKSFGTVPDLDEIFFSD